MNDPSLQPLRLTTPAVELRGHFLKIARRDVPDPLWHFEIAVAKSTRAAPSSAAIPPRGGPMMSLALFNRPDPPCDMEIFGEHLTHELDPADWLDLWIEQRGMQVLSRLCVPMLGGAVGDVVARWDVDSAPWMGRLFAMKAGPRLMLIWFRTPAEHYAALAESMFLSISTFRMLDDSPGPLAEPVRWASGKQPFAWRTAIPSSWEIKLERATERAASFQATLLAKSGEPHVPPTMLGKLSFAVIATVDGLRPAEVVEKMYEAVREAGAVVEAPGIADAAVAAPYLNGWRSINSALVNGNPAEVRARVLGHPKGYIAAVVLTPPRDVSPELWMRNKRLLDIALDLLEIS